MTYEEVTQKLDFLIRSYRNLIDNDVIDGKVVGPGVNGTWKADTPLTKAYQDMIEACSIAKLVIKQYRMLKSDCEVQNKWIHVSERLPEDGQNVLFCDIDNDIMVGYHIKGRSDTHFSQDGTYEDMKNVRAWMPLPKPYEPQESEVDNG